MDPNEGENGIEDAELVKKLFNQDKPEGSYALDLTNGYD